MKLLIIDDEPLILNKAKLAVNNSSLEFQKILTARNAAEAFAVIQNEKPEIILSDIQMPGKNGVDIAAYVNQKCPGSIVLFLTGYPEFEYAQAGIKHNVFDYILKPVSPEKLVQALNKAKQYVDRKTNESEILAQYKEYISKNKEHLQRELLENLLFQVSSIDTFSVKKQIQTLDLSYIKQYCLLGCKCQLDRTHDISEEYYNIHIAKYYVKQFFPDAFIFSYSNQLYVICINKSVEDIEAFLLDIQNHPIQYGEPFSWGISESSEDLLDIPLLEKQVTSCLSYCDPKSNISFIFYKDIKSLATIRITETHLLTQSLINFLSSMDRDAAINQGLSLIEEFRSKSNNVFSNFLHKFIDYSFVLFLSEQQDTALSVNLKTYHDKITQSDDFDSKASIFLNWISELYDFLNELNNTQTNYITKKILNYINEHFREQISLTSVAEYIGKSAPYTSTLIKQHTQRTFSQILTSIRIEEAKKLLYDTALPVQEISQNIGYPNVRYFTRLFKNEVNMTPNEYRMATHYFDV